MTGGPTRTAEGLVSVIIPSYNSAAYLPEAIESVLAQSYRPLEIIVIDDGSTDNTREQLQPYLTKISYLYQANQGVSAARNAGIRRASGELIAFLDADDTWAPEKLARQVEAFRPHPEAGVCFTDFSKFNDTGILRPSSLTENLQRWAREHPDVAEDVSFGSLYPELLQHNCVVTISVLARREALQAAGPFDETFRMCEDYDLWLRLALSYPFVYLNRVLCGYRYRPDSSSGPLEAREALWDIHNIKVLEKHLHNHWIPAEYQAMVRQLLSHRSFLSGRKHFDRDLFREARGLFSRCVRYGPSRAKHWVYFLATMLPPPMIETLRLLKRGFQRSAHPSVHT